MNRTSPHLASLLAALALVAPAALCAQGSTPTRQPLSPAAVASALAPEGLTVTAAQVSLPMPLTATIAAPALHIAAAELLPNGRLQLRLTCRIAAECLPFHATVDLHAQANAIASLAALPAAAGIPSNAVSTDPGSLRVGSRATLFIEGGHTRIQLPVISLDGGAPGTEVRVSSLDRKTLYRGIIVDRETVRGLLP